MAFVNFPLFDNGTAFSDLTVLVCDFFLGSYPFSCFVIKYASGGNLDVRFGKQFPFTEYEVDVVIGLAFVMKRFLDGILHIYDEGRTAVKMSDLFGIVAEAEARLAEKE